jgi:putative toxin-antitoxin system antitoxin component (TIGR02293 family)
MATTAIDVLGGRALFGGKRSVDLVEEIENGLPVQAYRLVSERLGLSPSEQTRLLNVSERTRARWKGRQRLDWATSDRLARVARIYALAIDVLQNEAHASAWLHEENDALAGKRPIDLCATDAGAEKVRDALFRMEYGVYA